MGRLSLARALLACVFTGLLAYALAGLLAGVPFCVFECFLAGLRTCYLALPRLALPCLALPRLALPCLASLPCLVAW